MNKIIRNALVYKAELPRSQALVNHLQENVFAELGSFDATRSGFVPVPQGFDFVEPFEGGYAFAVRFDEKILPRSVIKQEVAKRAKVIEDQEGYKIGRKAKKELEERVIQELLPVALIRSKVVTCYYDTTNGYLILPVSSRTVADTINGNLINAVGSIKTQTIHISDVKNGLTTRLAAWIEGDDTVFGENLGVGELVNLERVTEAKEKISINIGMLDQAKEGISEALASGFQVAALGMVHGSASFRLTSDFAFKSIAYDYEAESEADDPFESWKQDAAIQILELSGVVNTLCDLLGYKETEQEAEA